MDLKAATADPAAEAAMWNLGTQAGIEEREKREAMKVATEKKDLMEFRNIQE